MERSPTRLSPVEHLWHCCYYPLMTQAGPQWKYSVVFRLTVHVTLVNMLKRHGQPTVALRCAAAPAKMKCVPAGRSVVIRQKKIIRHQEAVQSEYPVGNAGTLPL